MSDSTSWVGLLLCGSWRDISPWEKDQNTSCACQYSFFFCRTRRRGWKWLFTHHWCLSERPFQSGSVRTIRSISFFHNIPSEMTLCHSLHTSSAEHRERASRKDKMFSAIWSKPWAKKGKRRTNSKGCFKTVNNVTALALIGVFFTWQRSDEVPLQHGFEVGVYVAVLVVAHTWDQALDKLHLVGLRPLVKQGDAVFLLLLIVSLWWSLTRAHYRSVSML